MGPFPLRPIRPVQLRAVPTYVHDGATGDGLGVARRDGVQREDLRRRVPTERPCGPGADVAGVSPCGPGADVGTEGRTRGD